VVGVVFRRLGIAAVFFRYGVNSNSSSLGGRSTEMREFGRILNDLELLDLALMGRMFTWFHPNGIR
jgi:hypothetical protein